MRAHSGLSESQRIASWGVKLGIIISWERDRVRESCLFKRGKRSLHEAASCISLQIWHEGAGGMLVRNSSHAMLCLAHDDSGVEGARSLAAAKNSALNVLPDDLLAGFAGGPPRDRDSLR